MNLQHLVRRGNNIIDRLRSRSMLSLLAQLNRVRRRMELLHARLSAEAKEARIEAQRKQALAVVIESQAHTARTLMDKISASTEV